MEIQPSCSSISRTVYARSNEAIIIVMLAEEEEGKNWENPCNLPTQISFAIEREFENLRTASPLRFFFSLPSIGLISIIFQRNQFYCLYLCYVVSTHSSERKKVSPLMHTFHAIKAKKSEESSHSKMRSEMHPFRIELQASFEFCD